MRFRCFAHNFTLQKHTNTPNRYIANSDASHQLTTKMFLKKLRMRRSNNRINNNKVKKEIIGKAPLLTKDDDDDNESLPDLGLTLTMSLSHEEEEQSMGDDDMSSTCTDMSSVLQYDESNPNMVMFTQQQVMENSLHHMRQLQDKQQEVNELRNVVLVELTKKHAERMAEKDDELAQSKHDFTEALQEKQMELQDVKKELVETKKELSTVSSVLIQCQHELHDAKVNNNKWAVFGTF